MALLLEFNIEKIAIIDDKKDARYSMAEIVSDANFSYEIVDEKIESFVHLFSKIEKSTQAAILDHHLNIANYANFTGAYAVSELFKRKFPALLVTAYSQSDIDQIRLFRKNIPVIISSNEFDCSDVEPGLIKCINELKDIYNKDRKGYKSLFRIENIDEKRKYAFIIIPAWDSKETIRLPFEFFNNRPVKIGDRFYARINIGTEKQEEIYIDNIEFLEKPKGDYAGLIRN